MSIIINIIGWTVLVSIAIIVFAACITAVRVTLDVLLVIVNSLGGKNGDEKENDQPEISINGTTGFTGGDAQSEPQDEE